MEEHGVGHAHHPRPADRRGHAQGPAGHVQPGAVGELPGGEVGVVADPDAHGRLPEPVGGPGDHGRDRAVPVHDDAIGHRADRGHLERAAQADQRAVEVVDGVQDVTATAVIAQHGRARGQVDGEGGQVVESGRGGGGDGGHGRASCLEGGGAARPGRRGSLNGSTPVCPTPVTVPSVAAFDGQPGPCGSHPCPTAELIA